MKQKKVLIWGYYGANNFGDDLIFNSVFELLNSNRENTSIFYTVKEKENAYNLDATPIKFFGRNHSNKALNFLINLKILFGTVLKMDAIIIGGGTQYFEIDSRKPVSILLKYLSCCLIKLKGGKFINAGVGIGEIKSGLGKFCLKRIFQKANYSFVRDHQSKETLLQLGVSDKNIIVGKDLSYYLPESKKEENHSDNKIKVGLNFFDYYDYLEKNPENRASYIEAIKTFIAYLQNLDKIEVYYFALQNETGGKDLEFMNEIRPASSNEILFYKDDFNGFVNQLGRMDFCIGLRYHFAVVAIQNCIPTIGINYQPKVERELKDFGLEDYVIQMDEIIGQTLISKFEEQFENKGLTFEIKNKLTAVKESLNIEEFINICKDI